MNNFSAILYFIAIIAIGGSFAMGDSYPDGFFIYLMGVPFAAIVAIYVTMQLFDTLERSHGRGWYTFLVSFGGGGGLAYAMISFLKYLVE